MRLGKHLQQNEQYRYVSGSRQRNKKVYVLDELIGYKKDKMSTDRDNGRGNKRTRVTRGSRNPKHGKRKAIHSAQT
jgi:hypothetical protein